MQNTNPFASPKPGEAAQSIVATGELERDLLAHAGQELARSRVWLICSGLEFLACAALALVATIYFIVVQSGTGPIASGACSGFIYGVSGLLLFRCFGKTQTFRKHLEPCQLEEVFAAEAEYWKFVGFITFGMTVISIATVITVRAILT